MNIEPNISLLEAILEPWKAKIGEDYLGYRNHVYRVLHLCAYLHKPDQEEWHKLIIAAAHHDIGIWSDNSADYLTPSIEQAKIYLQNNHRHSWIEEISLIIEMHHKVTAFCGSNASLVETFRRADWADFSLGFIRANLPRDLFREINVVFPNAGFHEMLFRLALKRIRQHPFSPAPMFRL
jgi:hypothetical protein